MQRISENLASQQTLARQLQQTLRQAKAGSNSVVIRLTTDAATCQSMNALLNKEILDAAAFLSLFIKVLQAYKGAHHTKLRKNQPEHRQIWQLMYGQNQQLKTVIKPLLKNSDYALDSHWDIWEPVFRHINRQLEESHQKPKINSVARLGLFASAAQKQEKMDEKFDLAQSQAGAHEASHPAPAPKAQITSSTVEACANDENIQPKLSLKARFQKFHRSHAVYFKFAKYLLIAGVVAAASLSASIGIALLLDLSLNIGAAPVVLGVIEEILAGMKMAIFFAAKELYQLAKKNAPQKLKDYAQASQARLNQNENPETSEPALPSRRFA